MEWWKYWKIYVVMKKHIVEYIVCFIDLWSIMYRICIVLYVCDNIHRYDAVIYCTIAAMIYVCRNLYRCNHIDTSNALILCFHCTMLVWSVHVHIHVVWMSRLNSILYYTVQNVTAYRYCTCTVLLCHIWSYDKSWDDQICICMLLSWLLDGSIPQVVLYILY
jgi:hypothetical protein